MPPDDAVPPADADPSRHRAGEVCWVDLGCPDVDTTVRFYGALFGWQIAPPDPTGYRIASLAGRPVAAFGPAEDPGPPYWTVYIRVDDAAAAVATAQVSGGAVVAQPATAGEAGIAAIVRSPSGVPISLWQPGTHAGTWRSGRPGTLAGAELRSREPAGDRAFFRRALGWELAADHAVRRDADTVARWQPAPPATRPEPAWTVIFHVDDPAETLRAARALGAHTDAGAPNLITDPTGARFAIIGTTGGHTRRSARRTLTGGQPAGGAPTRTAPSCT